MSQSGSYGRAGGRGGEPPLPDRIDHYDIVRRIGRGGQGEVYLGHDPNLDIDVAIKVLHTDFRAEEFIERFKVEARTAVRLTAPNIVRVFNFNPSYPYLVMEYCGNGDLDGRIKARRPLPLARLVSLMCEICDALTVAHSHRPPILHRDLKPGNVLFQGDVPKVADFGLAKMLGATTSGLTKTSGMMGTVGYASPEQLIDASKVDHRSDLWSLGCIFYELLTFRRPFEKPGDDYVNVAIKVRMEPPAPAPFELPEPIWRVIERVLQKDPAARYATSSEISAALRSAVAEVPGADELVLPPADCLGEIDRLAAEAASCLESGSTDNAQSAVEAMKKVSSDDPLARYWSRRLREARELEDSASDATATSDSMRQARWLEDRLNSIQDLLANREYRKARRQVGELLVEDPDNSVVQNYLQKINEQESSLSDALNRAHAEAAEARQAGDVARLHGIWKQLDEQYPGLKDVKAELAVAARELELAERRERRRETERVSERLREMGDLAGAVAAWDAYLESEPEDTEASAARDRLTSEIRANQRAERTSATSTVAERLRESGDLEAALETWEQLLAEDPDAAEAVARAEALRGEIADKKQETLLERTRARAESLLSKDDPAGALAVWQQCQSEIPRSPEARARVEELAIVVAEREEAGLREEVEGLAAVLETRLRGDRYRGLPSVRAGLAVAIEAGRTQSGPALRSARETLVNAERDAETRLADEIAALRRQYRPLLDEAGEMLEAEASSDTSSARTLRSAANALLEATCRSPLEQQIEDPLAPLARAGQEAERAIRRVAEEREEIIRASRARAAGALAAAREAVDAAPDDVAEGFRETLAQLDPQAQSNATGRLDAVAGQAETVRAGVAAACISAGWARAEQLQLLHVEALELLASAPAPRLAELARQAARALDPSGDAPVPDADVPRLIDELGREIESTRTQRESSVVQAGERWRAATAVWSALAADGLDPELRGEAERLCAQGAEALERSLYDEVLALADRLDSLTARARVHSIWNAQAATVAALEEPAHADGLSAAANDKETQELLTRYRKALARGDADGLESLGRELKDHATPSGAGGPRGLPSPSEAMRDLNAELRPSVLERFDRAFEDHERAESDGDDGRAARLAVEVEQAYSRLLQPVAVGRASRWPWAAAAAGLVGLIAWGYFLLGPGGDSASAVVLVSARGDVRVEEVTRDGERVKGFSPAELDVTESGVRWELEPGNYRLTTAAGREVRFRVPQVKSVLIPAGESDYASELMRELGLAEAIDSGDI